MSFGFVKAGKVEDVKAVLGALPEKPYGSALETLTRKYVDDVLAMQRSEGVIVEAGGHSDERQTNVSVTIRPVW